MIDPIYITFPTKYHKINSDQIKPISHKSPWPDHPFNITTSKRHPFPANKFALCETVVRWQRSTSARGEIQSGPFYQNAKGPKARRAHLSEWPARRDKGPSFPYYSIARPYCSMVARRCSSDVMAIRTRSRISPLRSWFMANGMGLLNGARDLWCVSNLMMKFRWWFGFVEMRMLFKFYPKNNESFHFLTIFKINLFLIIIYSTYFLASLMRILLGPAGGSQTSLLFDDTSHHPPPATASLNVGIKIYTFHTQVSQNTKKR